jgi:hypothetical protein
VCMCPLIAFPMALRALCRSCGRWCSGMPWGAASPSSVISSIKDVLDFSIRMKIRF